MLTPQDISKLGKFTLHGTAIPDSTLEAMADRMLQGTPDIHGVKTRHQMRHAARKERPRGSNPIRDGRNYRQVG